MYSKLNIIQMDDGDGWRDLGEHTHYKTLDEQIGVIRNHWEGNLKRPKFRKLIREINIIESEIQEIDIR